MKTSILVLVKCQRGLVNKRPVLCNDDCQIALSN